MSYPSLIEASLGCFLHDMGKLWQRAGGSQKNLAPHVASRASDILPSSQKGTHTHIHALWTDAFFEDFTNLFPQGLNHGRIRNLAVYHHKPDSASAELCTQADRIASGMDRKKQDEDQDVQSSLSGTWDKFIKTPLQSCFNSIHLNLPDLKQTGQPRSDRPAILPLSALGPNLFPILNPAPSNDPSLEKYKVLKSQMSAELNQLAASNSTPELFCEALLSISERYLSTVPSSTIDQPDISLHDHARAVAAVGTALYAFHQDAGTLDNRAAIRDANALKFVWVCGDLSGIQASLFQLQTQQVRGISKILRARSFLFAALLDAALLEIRTRLELPVFSVVINAGGRFVILAPNIPSVSAKINEAKSILERWLWNRYNGELAINIAVSQPFAGISLHLGNFAETFQLAESALREAKFTSFQSITNPIHEANYSHGVCSACGVRPGKVKIEEDAYRCPSCADEERLGRLLPRIKYVGWTREPESSSSIAVFNGWHLEWSTKHPSSLHRFASLFQMFQPDSNSGDIAVRFLANYVPRLSDSEINARRYQHLSEEARSAGSDDLKTFEHLGADALETFDSDLDSLQGEQFLGVLKADVDRLGLIFSSGIKAISLGRLSAVSRFLDLFFSGHLPVLLRDRYPSTYTVYAGGDDLLLIGPWNQMIQLSYELNNEFSRWTAFNTSITLSAAIELMKVSQPLNRSAANAEERLATAKKEGRNRLSLIDHRPFLWPEVGSELEKAERLVTWINQGKVSQALVYRVLSFDADRQAAEDHSNPNFQNAANWRSRWGYQIARNLPPEKSENHEVIQFLNSLLGLDQDLKKQMTGRALSPRTAVTIAIYRTRTGKEKRKDNYLI